MQKFEAKSHFGEFRVKIEILSYLRFCHQNLDSIYAKYGG